jgi:hypothetical protein
MIDKAFESRITLAIEYRALDPTQRRQIWTQNLNKAFDENKVTILNPEWLNEPLNGRQIRNIVMTAHSLWLSKPNKTAEEYIKIVLDRTRRFVNRIEESKKERSQELLSEMYWS